MATKKKTEKQAVVETPVILEAETLVAPVEKVVPVVRKRKTLSDLDLGALVSVKSYFYGLLHYRSQAGYVVNWKDFGDVQWVPIREIIVMRSEQPNFFVNGWIVPIGEDAQDIIDILQLNQYYRDASLYGKFDEIFNIKPEDVEAMYKKLNPAMKDTVIRRAYALIHEGTLDSRKMIDALTKATGCDFTDER